MPSESSARDTRRNPRIGRYEVLQYLATGGMGAVYRARDVEADLEVALKVLPPEIAVKPGMLERFRQEAIHAKKLRHEHIVTLFEYGEANHTHYLAMEFVDGIDLHEYVTRKGPLDPDEARVIIAQAALGLEHAHQQGIIHRDIKPSNFLITRNNGRLWVKLTDFGLARELNDEEFRITRAGNTVGTVDFMSPEQARDSRATDGRSDIYSLGCTLYFMLAGRPPFPEGGLTERILQHAEAEPKDICWLNPRVPHTLAALLQRMLAKKPANRYQSAAALLDDLERLRSGTGPQHQDIFTFLEDPNDSVWKRKDRAADVGAAWDHSGLKRQPGSSGRTRPRPDSSARRRQQEDTDEEMTSRTQAVPVAGSGKKPGGWYFPVLVTAVFILLSAAGGLVWWLSRPPVTGEATVVRPIVAERKDPEPAPVPPVQPEPPPVSASLPKPETQPPAAAVAPAVKPKPPKVANGLPQLYASTTPVPSELLHAEFLKPWTDAPARPSPIIFHVSRAAQPGGRHFTSLADACAAAPAGQETVIEIKDNGPLFVPAVAVQNRSLILRAAQGFRPLLAWESDPARGAPASAFLTVHGGNLTLENLELVGQIADAADGAEASLCRITGGGDFLARGCTFSLAGSGRTGGALVQLEGRPGEAGPRKTADGERTRCRLSACYLRGGDCVALDLRAPGVDLLLEDCLLTVGKQPLLSVAGQSAGAPTALRVLRSTLVAAQTVLWIRPALPSETRPEVAWLGWDAILTRSGAEPGGALAVVADNASAGGLKWQAVNCLYAGWQLLLAGREQFGAASISSWQARWGRTEGDRALAETWPVRTIATPWEEPAEAYRTAGSPLWFAGTAGGTMLGCNLASLPPVRDAWVALTYSRFPTTQFALPTELIPPEIPAAGGGVYQGERLNVQDLDLGEYLEKVRQRTPFGPKVVLQLTGSGEHHTSPIRLQGSSLLVYVEPAADGSEPLVLTYSQGKTNPTALIEVDGGDLELHGVALKLNNSNFLPHPRYLVKVRGGDLRVFGCRLTGPLGRAPRTFDGLIGFEGSGASSTEQAHDCGIANSVLAAGNSCIHSIGPGARVRLRNSVLVAGRDAIYLDPGPAATFRLNAQCVLESCTVTARRAVVRLGDNKDLLTLEPFVLQARNTVFLDPFLGDTHEAALLAFDGDALARGLLVWQGDGNAYDRRLPYRVAPTGGSVGDRPHQSHELWSRLWGSSGERTALELDLSRRTFDLDKLPLETLVLPASLSGRRKEPLGADLVQLRLVKKPEKPKSGPSSP